MEDAFVFDDYTNEELLQALEMKMKQADLSATDAAKKVAIDVLDRARSRPHFGNIGAVDNILTQAKSRQQRRRDLTPDTPFEPEDFDPDYDRLERASDSLVKLFEDVTGSEDIVVKLTGWQDVAKTRKQRGRDPRGIIPMSFVFKGPPGKLHSEGVDAGTALIACRNGEDYYRPKVWQSVL